MTTGCAGGALPAVGELGEDLAVGVAALAVPHVQAEQALKEGAGRGDDVVKKPFCLRSSNLGGEPSSNVRRGSGGSPHPSRPQMVQAAAGIR